MTIYDYGNKDASVVLIQPVDDHDMEGIENEIAAIREITDTDFLLLAVKVSDWNRDLSPWNAPAVFGKEDFGGGAEATLKGILSLCTDERKTYDIGGYSLAGLFAIWASCQTDRFTGVAAASPSLWFPEFTEYMRRNKCKSKAVYLSLGDKEEKTKNPVMRTVGDRICEAYEILCLQEINCTLEWNQGNHFKEPDRRTARAFAWVMHAAMHDSMTQTNLRP